MKKKEKWIVLGILLFALILWGMITLFQPHDYGTVLIQVNGEEYGTYPLTKDQVISIGSTNICEIKDGRLTMIEATCPDHLCMKQGAIDNGGGMIVCLPNKVTIEGKRNDVSDTGSTGVDAIAR